LIFTLGRLAIIKGTSDTHASHDQLIGGCINVSITALATNMGSNSKIGFILTQSQTSANFIRIK
jgi:hypothetical protein